jgi:hypothetical protein
MADVIEQQVQAKVAEFKTVLQKKKVAGLDMEAVLDLDAAARYILQKQSSNYSDDNEDKPLAKAELHGFCDLAYTIHLNPTAVFMLEKAAGAVCDCLKAAVEEYPELEMIFFALWAYVKSESAAIKAASAAADGGAVRLDGILPSPFALPTPDDWWYWEDITVAPTDSGAPAESGDGGNGDVRDIGGRKGPGDIWDPGDV